MTSTAHLWWRHQRCQWCRKEPVKWSSVSARRRKTTNPWPTPGKTCTDIEDEITCLKIGASDLPKSGVLSCFISPLFMRKASHIFHAFSIFLYGRSFWLQLLIITERKQTAAEANGKIPAQTTKVTGNLTQISSFRWCWFQPKHIRLTGSAIAGPCLGWKMQKDILKPSNQVSLNPSS